MLLVSGNSKNRAAPQGRMSWAQRVRTTQAVSLPIKAQSKVSAQRTEEITDNKVYGQSQTRQSSQSDVGSNWRVQSGVAGDKTADSYTSHRLKAWSRFKWGLGPVAQGCIAGGPRWGWAEKLRYIGSPRALKPSALSLKIAKGTRSSFLVILLSKIGWTEV